MYILFTILTINTYKITKDNKYRQNLILNISKWNDKTLCSNNGVTIVNILDSNVNDNNTFDGLLLKISFDVRTLQMIISSVINDVMNQAV